MSVEARTTIDDDLDRKLKAFTLHRFGIGKNARSKCIENYIRQGITRDIAAWEKKHAQGSLPGEGGEKSQG